MECSPRALEAGQCLQHQTACNRRPPLRVKRPANQRPVSQNGSRQRRRFSLVAPWQGVCVSSHPSPIMHSHSNCLSCLRDHEMSIPAGARAWFLPSLSPALVRIVSVVSTTKIPERSPPRTHPNLTHAAWCHPGEDPCRQMRLERGEGLDRETRLAFCGLK